MRAGKGVSTHLSLQHLKFELNWKPYLTLDLTEFFLSLYVQFVRKKQNSVQTFLCLSHFSFIVFVSATAVKLKKEFQQDDFHTYRNLAGFHEVER